MESPKISLYMVYNNYLDHFETAFSAVINQTFDDYEIIVLDYSPYESNDFEKLEEITKKYNRDIRLYRQVVPNFIEAIKFCMYRAAGKYIIRADCDDVLRATALEDLYNYAEQTKSDLVYPNYVLDFNSKRSIEGNIEKLACHCLSRLEKFKEVQYLPTQEFRDGIALFQYFNTMEYKINYLKKALFYHRKHKNSLTEVRKKDIIDIDERIRAYYAERF